MDNTTPTPKPLTREQALVIVKKYLTNQNLLKHSFAAEAAMKAIYKKLYPLPENATPEQVIASKAMEDVWGITGLLHDADYEMSKDHPEKHGLLLFEKEDGIPQDITYAIKAHNWENTLINPTSPMDWGIACCDQLTGLVVAAALIHPEKKLASINTDFIMNRFNEKTFAKGAKRESILLCEEKLGIPLREFVFIVLTSMQEISNELGL